MEKISMKWSCATVLMNNLFTFKEVFVLNLAFELIFNVQKVINYLVLFNYIYILCINFA